MFIEIDTFKVPMPKMPPPKEIINYGLPPEKQFFKRTEIPKTLLKEKECTADEERFIEGEYHKFDNGIWIYIKGQPFYIPGDYYHFLNYWSIADGSKPYFYLPQQKLYNLYNFLDRDPDCLGTMLLKARRMRATEMVIHRGYFQMMRTRGKNFLIQSKTDDTAEAIYQRALKAHDKMIWFVKPINAGSSKNKEGLIFEYPSVRITEKKLKEQAEKGREESVFEYPEIGSQILYGPSRATHWDSWKARYCIISEYAKLENMSLTKVIGILKHCVTMNNLKTVIGKLHCESTVEELNETQFEEVINFWNNSDPLKRNKNGRTTSGLYRIFVSAAETGEPDEWGLVDYEATLKYVQNTINDFVSQGKIKEAADERRRTPLTIEDALTPSGSDSAFDKEKLLETAARLNFPEPDAPSQTVRGNFEWENGIQDSRVIFIPNAEGRWVVNKLYGFDTNFNIQHAKGVLPANTHLFRSGVDPFDHKLGKDSRRSDGASVVFELYNHLKDGDKFEVGDDGFTRPVDGGLNFQTCRPICIYRYRHEDPEMFYEDMLKQSVYYGTMLLCENNKPGIMRYFDKRGYQFFVQNRPKETLTNKNQKVTEGIAASDSTISQYFAAIANYVSNYHNNIVFIEIINELITMNRENVTKHDLGVALGWCLLACNDANVPIFRDLYTQQQESVHWFDWVEN